MKTVLLISTAVILAACSSSQTKMVNAGEIGGIRHICIIENYKVMPQMAQRLADALNEYGISSEIVQPEDKQRLYSPACPYNLRYKGLANPKNIEHINILIRTPDHEVSGIRYTRNEDRDLITQPDLAEQTRRVVGRLLGKY
ncbi:MAG: hypothetical protein Q3966_08845 [Neisseria sp.]|nr:hypothetical protein [Neisseria sp.]